MSKASLIGDERAYGNGSSVSYSWLQVTVSRLGKE